MQGAGRFTPGNYPIPIVIEGWVGPRAVKHWYGKSRPQQRQNVYAVYTSNAYAATSVPVLSIQNVKENVFGKRERHRVRI